MRSIITLLVLLAMAGGSHAQVRTDEGRRPIRDWVDPDLGRGITEGIATEDTIWLLGQSRNVVRFDRRTGERMTLAAGVVDLLPDGRRLWALTVANETQSTVRDLRDPLSPTRQVNFEGTSLALFPTPDGPGVLTSEKVLLPTSDRWSRHRLAGSIGWTTGVSPIVNDALYVGYNHGEWGGGLRRIDINTGTVSIVKEAGREPCRGALDPECTPVVGVIADTSNIGCVLIGTSLSHLSIRSGEIFRVCGNDISLAFRDPLPLEPDSIVDPPGRSWPFNSLIPASDGWLAIGQTRFARLQADVVTVEDIPELHAWSGIQISEETDGFIFIEAACCWESDVFVQYRILAIPVLQ